MSVSSIQDPQNVLPKAELERLRDAARAAERWDVILRPNSESSFSRRVSAARAARVVLERAIASKQGPAGSPTTPEETAMFDLRQSPRLLRMVIADLSDKRRMIDKLPRISIPNEPEEPRIAKVAALYLQTVDGAFAVQSFRIFIDELQVHEPLLLDELWNAAAYLRFATLENLLRAAREFLQSKDAAAAELVLTNLRSLRSMGTADWVSLTESLIVLDATLRKDPAGAYAAMDFESRELYRKRIALIAAHSDLTECEVAETALLLAQECLRQPVDNPRIQHRRIHVGYYLVNKGFAQLAARSAYHAPIPDQIRTHIRAHADFYYITVIQSLTIIFIAALVAIPLPHASVIDILIAAFLLILPASQSAVDLVNNIVMSVFDPYALPKLDFSKGIPPECATLVAVPTLLLHEKQVRELVNDLEVRYIANRDPNLHFALLTDLPDSVTKPRDKDFDPLVDLATRLINELNAKYGSAGKGTFVFLHRHRIFNNKQGAWMGWERKRGKLIDLNKFMAGEFDAFPIKAGDVSALPSIRYVLTLDSDTQLPRGSAAKLVGAIAHPLNQAVIDPTLRIVTDGYGILQPRIGVAVQSASRSRLASIYSGQSGFDIYTRAVSDAYQDLYDEGSFTGKGIYEAETLHEVLSHRFPPNALLSHDLIEGAYARAGLAADIELIDDYPSHLSAYSRRKHRWVRGDWQIAPWMFTRVRDESRHWVTNPISEISRWKIFDNLRRSLVEPFTFILFVAGWIGLPGGPGYWTAVSLFLLFLPSLVQLFFGLVRAYAGGHSGAVSQVWSGVGKGLLITVFNLAFLPDQTLLAIDAIVRALVRQFITGQRLLEWETAAQAELGSRRSPADRYLALAPLVSAGVAIVVYLAHPHGKAIFIAAPILILWGLATLVKAWLNAPPREEKKRLSRADESFLQDHALLLWRFFGQFGVERHHHLIPDNVEEEGMFEAARVSPTNVGLLLNARQAACEFGFLTVPEFVDLTEKTLATMDRLKKHRGHLVNWYDTETLAPLGDAPFISSVDSGNLIASLMTLQSGALDRLTRPLLSAGLFEGIRVHWRMMTAQRVVPSAWAHVALPGTSSTMQQWVRWVADTEAAIARSNAAQSSTLTMDDDAVWWPQETLKRISSARALIRGYLPWLDPEFDTLRDIPELAVDDQAFAVTVEGAIGFAEALGGKLDQRLESTATDDPQRLELDRLRKLLPATVRNLRALERGLRSIAISAERLAAAMEFGFLIDPSRRLLSIGYDTSKQVLLDSCYDRLASEARVATFLAIARGELPKESWFKLGRDHTLAFGCYTLLSWTGTMFEYLMPALWMRRYHDTLISRTLDSCVSVQRAFAGSLQLPWGISESGESRKDDAGHYQYHAFGVPQLALSYAATAGPVISPYSSFLALGVDSIEALRNLRRMVSAGWVGSHGFYEAADFSKSSSKPILVREWMAHHQGMSLLAVLNLLNDNIVQRWFHASPLVQSTELLLHEAPIHKAMLKAEWKKIGAT